MEVEGVDRTADNIKKMTHKEGYVWYRLKRDGKYGVVDAQGHLLVPPRYEDIAYSPTGGGWYWVIDDGTRGAYTLDGKMIADTGKYSSVWVFESNGHRYVNVREGNKEGILDINGNVLVEPNANYKNIMYNANSGSFEYYKDGNRISLNIGFPKDSTTTPSPVTTPTTGGERKEEFDGFVWYKTEKNGKYGASDGQGRVIVPAKYDIINYSNAFDGHFLVDLFRNGNHTQGVYNKSGEVVIPDDKYNQITGFHTADGDFFMVEADGKEGACDTKGNLILHLRYKGLTYEETKGFICNDASGKSYPIGIRLVSGVLTAITEDSPSPSSSQPSSIKDDNGN